MSDVTLTIERESLGLGPLVITGDPSGSLWVQVVEEPGFEFEYAYAPKSPHMAGQQLLAASLGMSALPCVIYARASSMVALRAVKNELTAAVSQFVYDITLDRDGDVITFSSDPTWPTWSADEGMVSACMASTSLSFRVNPPGA